MGPKGPDGVNPSPVKSAIAIGEYSRARASTWLKKKWSGACLGGTAHPFQAWIDEQSGID